jgi:hypothetical protein
MTPNEYNTAFEEGFREGFFNGFSVTGEGFNAEYPFNANVDELKAEPEVVRLCEAVMARRHEVSVKDALEIIAAGNTDPDRMVELAQQALKTLNGEKA